MIRMHNCISYLSKNSYAEYSQIIQSIEKSANNINENMDSHFSTLNKRIDTLEKMLDPKEIQRQKEAEERKNIELKKQKEREEQEEMEKAIKTGYYYIDFRGNKCISFSKMSLSYKEEEERRNEELKEREERKKLELENKRTLESLETEKWKLEKEIKKHDRIWEIQENTDIRRKKLKEIKEKIDYYTKQLY
jgi:hypothetical protein